MNLLLVVVLVAVVVVVVLKAIAVMATINYKQYTMIEIVHITCSPYYMCAQTLIYHYRAGAYNSASPALAGPLSATYAIRLSNPIEQSARYSNRTASSL